MLNLFYGEKEHQVDEKFRVRIPSCFKDMLGKEYVFARGANHTIDIYPKEVSDEMLKKTFSKFGDDVDDPNVAKLLMQYASFFMSVEEDGQGRVVIPESMRSYANITKGVNVVTVGAINHLVLMTSEQRKQDDADTNHYDVSQRLKKLKLEN